MALSELQKKIVEAKGKVVVKACPGSGKTYSVAARIAYLLKTNTFRHNGISAISFTDSSWREINEKIESDFNVSTPLTYPHFVGGVDSFLNKFIFFPYGHLVMQCDRRPEIIGEDFHNRLYWENPRRYGYKGLCSYIDPMEHLENVSYDKDGNPLAIADPKVFNFCWSKIHTKKGAYIKRVQEILEVKEEFKQKGYANQSDANYYSLKILQEYPQIVQNIVSRFPFLIIDDAQDINDIQMEIIDLLVENGLEEIMLIGDPNQAIFEWKHADPELFEEKYNEWHSISLNENLRSSASICTCANAFISKEVSKPQEDGELVDFDCLPIARAVDFEDVESVKHVIDLFLDDCKGREIAITKDHVAVLYRSENHEKYFGVEKIEFNDQPWKTGAFHLRDIVKGKYLIEQGEIKDGFKLLEQGYFKGIYKLTYAKQEDIQKVIDDEGFILYRKKLYDFIDQLPSCNMRLYDWLNLAKPILEKLGIVIDITVSKSKVMIGRLFNLGMMEELPYYHGTIHSSKGRTFEAVLVLLGERASDFGTYKNLFNVEYEELESKKQEELRIVYVAITRPRKILNIGVPQADYEIWQKKLQLDEL